MLAIVENGADVNKGGGDTLGVPGVGPRCAARSATNACCSALSFCCSINSCYLFLRHCDLLL